MRLASSVLLSALCIITLCCPVSAELKVGFIGGFSGAGKAFGDAARNGFELARTDLGNHEISVQYEDDQFDPKKTVAAFPKLTRSNKVDLIIVLGSTPAATISPLAERSQIPTIAWASNQQITSGRKWVIRS